MSAPEDILTAWIEYEYGDHEWHQPDPLINKCCKRCGAYDTPWYDGKCKFNAVHQRTHYVGPWKPLL